MKRRIVPGIALAAALAISACGGGAGSGKTAAPAGTKRVSIAQVAGVGRVLVDRSGKPAYASDQEANGNIVCSGGCTAFWKPITVAGGAPSAGAGRLGVIKRPDGTMQVTADGRPLYTFSEDSPGKATGDGFTDDFGGHHFTWHVVRSSAKTSGPGGAGATPKTNRSGSEHEY